MGSEAEARVGGCLEVRRVVVCSVSAGLRIGGSVGVRGAVSLGELAGLRGDKGVGSGSETYPEQPAHAGRQRSGGDRHIRAGARRCVTRRRHRRVVGPIVVRHQLRGARTAVTRRPRRGGEGYVMARRLWGGARTVMPHCARRRGARGVAHDPAPLARGYVSTRCPRGGARTVMVRWTAQRGVAHGALVCRARDRSHGRRMTRQPRRRGEGMVMTRRHGVRGRATAGGRHDGASDSLPGAARCSRIVLHLPLPNVRSYWAGVGKDNGGLGRASPPGPLSTWWRGGVGRIRVGVEMAGAGS